MTQGHLEFAMGFTTNVTVVGATETVIATLGGVTLDGPNRSVIVQGWAQWTTGADATGYKFRIRRGTDATGTLVGEANTEQIYAAAGSTQDDFVAGIDLPGELASGSYVMTVQQSGGTADGSALQGYIRALVLSG